MALEFNHLNVIARDSDTKFKHMTFTCSFLPISYVQLKTGSIFLLLPRNFAISCSERNNIRSKSSDCGKPRSIANPPEKFHRDSKLGISKLNRIFKRVIPMAWFCSGSTNAELVGNLFQARLIQNERVRNAMLGVCSTFSPLFW